MLSRSGRRQSDPVARAAPAPSPHPARSPQQTEIAKKKSASAPAASRHQAARAGRAMLRRAGLSVAAREGIKTPAEMLERNAEEPYSGAVAIGSRQSDPVARAAPAPSPHPARSPQQTEIAKKKSASAPAATSPSGGPRRFEQLLRRADSSVPPRAGIRASSEMSERENAEEPYSGAVAIGSSPIRPGSSRRAGTIAPPARSPRRNRNG